MRKVGWLVLALFAPELVVYTAWQVDIAQFLIEGVLF